MASSLSDILSTIQNGVIALNNMAAQIKGSFTAILSRFTGYEAAWTAYTPTIAALGGVFTTVSGAGRYKQNGKTIFLTVNITITTNGAAAIGITSTVPVTATGNASFSGRENAVAGFGLAATLVNPTSILIQKYDASYPGADGYVLNISGVYEAA